MEEGTQESQHSLFDGLDEVENGLVHVDVALSGTTARRGSTKSTRQRKTSKASDLMVNIPERERSNSQVSDDGDSQDEDDEELNIESSKLPDHDFKAELKSLISEAIMQNEDSSLEEIQSESVESYNEKKLTRFATSQIEYAELFEADRKKGDLIYDSLFYPHHVRSNLLIQKRKKKSSNQNPLSSPHGVPDLNLNVEDSELTIYHLYYMMSIIKSRQEIQLKQYLKGDTKLSVTASTEHEYPIFTDDSIEIHVNDLGVSVDTLCYCLESNRYLDESEEGKVMKSMNNTFSQIVITKKKLVAYLSLYPEFFTIQKPRKNLDLVSLNYLCFGVENNQTRELIKFKVNGSNIEIVNIEDNNILLSIAYRNLPEKITLDANNEEHIKSLLNIITDSFPKGKSSFKISVLKRILFSKYDFKPYNIVPFMHCFPQFFELNKKGVKVKRLYPTVMDYKPKVENVMFLNKSNSKAESKPVEGMAMFELPKTDYSIIFTTEEKVVDQWIQENVFNHFGESNDQKVVVGMDTEFDFFKLNKNYQLNPVLHEKLWKIFKKQQQFTTTTSISVYDEKEYSNLKQLYFKEYEQTVFPDLIQLSTGKSCLLYGTSEGKAKPSNLFVELMYDKRVIKTWCSMHEDVKLISLWIKHYNMILENREFEGLIELDPSQLGASTLCEQLLSLKMAKERTVQVSRWSRFGLSKIQTKYSAQDSYLNYLLYNIVSENKEDLTQVEEHESISFSLFDPSMSI
ncbi:predicted protein [Naegleria gruberi]|uniref:3'-5' exonuclease n=1 Tax=Naegleria gruberi TaxID=5762 RepID=D2VH33_NAEGR|nr:uncharacterized protein NAEGRDRAFT_79962 [Naegleria gruberi]EFC43821.1 predicted protein [Naegleria gruberi]|eukprot:XP_002676565.1 predicted protein [Naegleria gruberi strain NEG-M]